MKRVELQSPRPGSDELRSWPVARRIAKGSRREVRINKKRKKEAHAHVSIIAVPVTYDALYARGYVRINVTRRSFARGL